MHMAISLPNTQYEVRAALKTASKEKKGTDTQGGLKGHPQKLAYLCRRGQNRHAPREDVLEMCCGGRLLKVKKRDVSISAALAHNRNQTKQHTSCRLTAPTAYFSARPILAHPLCPSKHHPTVVQYLLKHLMISRSVVFAQGVGHTHTPRSSR